MRFVEKTPAEKAAYWEQLYLETNVNLVVERGRIADLEAKLAAEKAAREEAEKLAVSVDEWKAWLRQQVLAARGMSKAALVRSVLACCEPRALKEAMKNVD